MTSNISDLVAASSRHGRSELERIDYLDGWRGIAILFVLYSHFLSSGGMNAGRLGVDIFFVLSGFLMSRILFVKRVNLSTFYKRRGSRILPAFLLFVIAIYSFDAIFAKTGEADNVLSTVIFARTYFPSHPDIWHTGLPISHLWSLNVEEHSYVFLSVITLIGAFRNREAVILIVFGCLSILIHAIYVYFPSIAPPMAGLRTEAAASHLLLSAGYFLISDRVRPFIKPWMPVLTFILGIFCYTEFSPWWFSLVISPFALAFSVNHLSDTYHTVHRILSLNLLRLMGIWSYSIYLWQQPFFYYRTELTFGNEYLAIIPAITAGVVSFYMFENPLRRFINNRI